MRKQNHETFITYNFKLIMKFLFEGFAHLELPEELKQEQLTDNTIEDQ